MTSVMIMVGGALSIPVMIFLKYLPIGPNALIGLIFAVAAVTVFASIKLFILIYTTL